MVQLLLFGIPLIEDSFGDCGEILLDIQHGYWSGCQQMRIGLSERLTFRILLYNRMTELNHSALLIIGDMISEGQVLIEITSVKYTGRKPDLFDICVDMIFSLVYLRNQTPT